MDWVAYNVVFSLYGETRKLLNIGGPVLDPSSADIPFNRIIDSDDNYSLYISGSTIKGGLRTSSIRISNILGYKVTYSVEPSKISSCEDIICSLYGAPGKEGKIIVSDSYIDIPLPQSHILTHITIDDKYGVKKERGLFTCEYIPIGIKINFKVQGYELTIEEARLLLLSLYELRYEKIGKGGLLYLWINKEDSQIPDELLLDKVFKVVYNELIKK